MRRNRLIRMRGKRAKKEALDLDITSLLDILVIMLVFLLNSYSTAGFVVDLPRGVNLPMSEESEMISTSGINIQVSPTTIWVDDEEVLNVQELMQYPERNLDLNERRIVPLYDKLQAKKLQIKEITKSSPSASDFSGMANLVIDESIRYSLVKKIMFTIAEAGFQQYKFIVMGEEASSL